MLKEVRIGKIVATHGLRGEVKVLPTTDDISRFKELKSVILRKTSRGMRSENAGGGNGDQKKSKAGLPRRRFAMSEFRAAKTHREWPQGA